jgi:hypothetical protein
MSTMLVEGGTGECPLCHHKGMVEFCHKSDGDYLVFIHFGTVDEKGLLIKQACWIRQPENTINKEEQKWTICS